jgi:hypothetical protein
MTGNYVFLTELFGQQFIAREEAMNKAAKLEANNVVVKDKTILKAAIAH